MQVRLRHVQIWTLVDPPPLDSAIKWTEALTAFATVAAAAGTLATLIFFGLQLRQQSRALRDQREASTCSLRALSEQIAAQTEQTRYLAEQTRLQTEQAKYVAEQTKLLTQQTEVESSAAELNFNLGVMIRLQQVLYEIADDDAAWEHLWGGTPKSEGLPDCRRPVLGVWAMLDVLSMALAACDRLPNFSRNQLDWLQYTLDTLHQSPNLLKEALEVGKIYWPELYPVAYAYSRGGVRQAIEYMHEKGKWERTLRDDHSEIL